MDYEKKHNELVGKIKKAYLYAQTDSTKAVLEDILPELKESKDERIRKVIYDWIYLRPSQFFDDGFSKEEMLAWLEKQVEQKLSWSEEDKDIMYDTLSNLTELKDRYGEGYGNVGKCIGWLKTLKERYTWKPSDEQIKAIRLARSFVVDDFGEHPTLSEILMELEEQLQKIKEGQTKNR